MKMWVIERETMNIASARGGANGMSAREERRIAATRFMWIPGKRPVNVPRIIPAINASIISIIIPLTYLSGINKFLFLSNSILIFCYIKMQEIRRLPRVQLELKLSHCL